MVPTIGAFLPIWPGPELDTIRARWEQEAEQFRSGPDYGYQWIPNQPPELYDIEGTERWDICFGIGVHRLRNEITAHLGPADFVGDPEFEEAVGWTPHADFWIEVWSGDDRSYRFARAAALVHEVALLTDGVIQLDHREAPLDQAFVTEMYAYVTASVFERMMGEPDFAHRMI